MEKIYQIAAGIHYDIDKLCSLTDLLKEIQKTLQAFIETNEKNHLYEYEKIKQDVADLTKQLKIRGLPESNNYEKDLDEIKQLINSDDWSEAVYTSSICDDQEKCDLRADQILDQFVCESIKNKKFLDYGCGEGQVVMKAKEREASFFLGYDLQNKNLKIPKQHFEDNFHKVSENGPYDIILAHDVLDHIVGISPIEALIQIKSVISPNGKLYVKNHPWSSRHGGHTYLQANKAFLHLILDDVELARLYGIECEHNLKITNPLETYPYWFEQAGFKIIQENPIIEEVELMFQEPSKIKDRLAKNFKNPQSMVNQMKISFVEYVLEPNNSIHHLL